MYRNSPLHKTHFPPLRKNVILAEGQIGLRSEIPCNRVSSLVGSKEAGNALRCLLKQQWCVEWAVIIDELDETPGWPEP